MFPQHYLFAKDYMPSKPAKPTAQDFEVDNSNGFFDDLPPCKSRKKGMVVGMSKAKREEMKLQALKLAQQKM